MSSQLRTDIMNKSKHIGNRKDSNFFLIILCLIFTVFISLVQYILGPEFALTLFYLFPIILATWKVGIWAGIIISFIGAILWLITDLIVLHTFSNDIIPFLNITFRLIGFLITTYIVSELKTALETHKDLARTDPLTSISNKRAFYELSSMELNKAHRSNHPFSVICMDLDNFKEVNDTLGHNAGDILLKTVASNIKENIRKVDLVGRLGGDEFGIVLSETDEDSAYSVATKLQQILLSAMQENGWPVTFSIGIATFTKPPESVEEMIQKADILMYNAKKNGKNMIKHQIITAVSG